MGIKLLSRRCLPCVAKVRHLHTPGCPLQTLRIARRLCPRADQSKRGYEHSGNSLPSRTYHCQFSPARSKSSSEQASHPLGLQISPDFFTENRGEIVSRIEQHDFSGTPRRQFKKAAEEDFSKFAVFIPFCIADGEPSVLFNVRSAKLTSHRGQVSFPGGRIDDSDNDVTHTALREMEEELGIAESFVDVWGELPPSLTPKLQYIHVLAGFIGHFESLDFSLNPDEVESVFTVTLRHLCDLTNRRHTVFEVFGSSYSSSAFLGAERRVWGITANALDNALSIILPGDYVPTREHFDTGEGW